MDVSSYYDLGIEKVAISFALVILVVLLSFVLKLGLIKTILWASLRTVLQLSVLGFVLAWVFSLDAAVSVLSYGTVMVVIAGYTAGRRPSVKVKRAVQMSIASIFAASWFVSAFALIFVVDVSPWYSPQYLIPFLGLILGNMLNGVSLGLDNFLSALRSGKDEIECYLSLGASRSEAAKPFLKKAIRTGLIPILNAMAIVGVVSIPGMMTGQLLAGADPISAVKYQIVVMFLIAGASALGTVLVCYGMYFQLFNKSHQFQYRLLKEK